MHTKSSDILYCGVDKMKIKNASPCLNEKHTGDLLTFIVNRYRVHVRKDVKGLPPPWTKDPVISQYKFTNVRREHDRQTRYLIDNISLNPSLTLEEKIVNTFLFRAWNNWDTMKSFGGPWSAEEIYSAELKESIRPLFKKLESENPSRKWWSSAYNQGGTKAAWKFPEGDGYQRAYSEAKAKKFSDWEADIPLRVFHIGPWLKRDNVVERLLHAKNQQQVFEVIHSIRGFADFLAYQVFVDLTYIKKFPFSENEFVVAGPGCKKGLNYLFDDFDGLSYEEALFWLRDNIDHCFYALQSTDYSGPAWNPQKLFSDLPEEDRHMNVMSLENCFCELSKYIRTLEGTGRPRVTYKIKQ